MNRVLTERLRLTVPETGNLEGHKYVLELMLTDSGRVPSDEDRASALTDYGRVKHRFLPLAVFLRESQDMVGIIRITMNLDAFTLDRDGGITSVRPNKPLEFGLHVFIYHRHQGHGYGLEAARAFVDYATNVLGARRILAESKQAEPQARRLMERLGMFIRPEPSVRHPDRIVGVIEAHPSGPR